MGRLDAAAARAAACTTRTPICDQQLHAPKTFTVQLQDDSSVWLLRSHPSAEMCAFAPATPPLTTVPTAASTGSVTGRGVASAASNDSGAQLGTWDDTYLIYSQDRCR